MVATTTSEPSAPRVRLTAGWPLARRVGLSTLRPGGRAMTRRLFEGAGVGEGARVVDLAPGAGHSAAMLNDVNLHAWTGVCVDAAQQRQVQGRVRGLGRTTVRGAADATGLPDAEATAVVCEGLLSALSGPSAIAVLAEARRVVRPGGLVAFHELARSDDAWDPDDRRGIGADLGRFGLRLRDIAEWRVLATAAGLEPIGTLTGPVYVPDLPELAREAGPRGLPRLMGLAAPTRGAQRAREVAYRLEHHGDALCAVVVVARRPVLARGPRAV